MKRRQLFPQPWWLHDDLTFWAPLCDPANPLAVYRGTGPLSMTRATVALRFDGSKFVSVGNGVLRIEPQGALIEGARTFDEMFYTDNSQDFLAQWTKTGITALFEADATAFGGSRWTLTADGSDRIFVRSITIAAAARSLAWYVRRTDGGVVDTTFCQIYREGAARASTYTLLGGGVYRVSEVNFTGSAGAADTGLQIKAGKTLQVVAPAGLEAGAFCSSPMAIADAAVTRNADVLKGPTSGNITEDQFTAAYEYIRWNSYGGDPNSAPLLIGNYTGIDSMVIGGYPSGSVQALAYFGGGLWDINVVGTNLMYTYGVQSRFAWRLGSDSKTVKGYRNGLAGDSQTSATAKTGTWAGGVFGVGVYPEGSDVDTRTRLHIKNLRSWKRAFTDAEMQNLTR